MWIYEVNLKILTTIFDEYMAWLTPHVEEMLTFQGFQSARYLSEDPATDEDFTQLTVAYEVASLTDLEHYFAHHAQAMREDGMKRFPNQFSATRRIMEVKRDFRE